MNRKKQVSLSNKAGKVLEEAIQEITREVIYFWAYLGVGSEVIDSDDGPFWQTCDIFNRGHCCSTFKDAFRHMYELSSSHSEALPSMPNDSGLWFSLHSWMILTPACFIRYVDSIDAMFAGFFEARGSRRASIISRLTLSSHPTFTPSPASISDRLSLSAHLRSRSALPLSLPSSLAPKEESWNTCNAPISCFSIVCTMTSTEAGMGQSAEPKKISSASNATRASPSMFRRWGRRHPFIRYGLPMISLTVLGAVGLGHLLQGSSVKILQR
uniref:Uncharacterized protein n=1 Tax=Cucumis sativus TaxID=3659 RepID=A0A0A0KTK7_CUCSA